LRKKDRVLSLPLLSEAKELNWERAKGRPLMIKEELSKFPILSKGIQVRGVGLRYLYVFE